MKKQPRDSAGAGDRDKDRDRQERGRDEESWEWKMGLWDGKHRTVPRGWADGTKDLRLPLKVALGWARVSNAGREGQT